jgi:hypothetical protein
MYVPRQFSIIIERDFKWNSHGGSGITAAESRAKGYKCTCAFRSAGTQYGNTPPAGRYRFSLCIIASLNWAPGYICQAETYRKENKPDRWGERRKDLLAAGRRHTYYACRRSCFENGIQCRALAVLCGVRSCTTINCLPPGAFCPSSCVTSGIVPSTPSTNQGEEGSERAI